MPLPDFKHLTFGAEHELSDWDTQRPLPAGCSRSPDYTIVNSNGVAAQPNPKHYRYGGEVNTPPTDTPAGQVMMLEQILKQQPECTINYRSNLHTHVRVPGLKDNLEWLKYLQKYIHEQLPLVIDLLEPIPAGTCAGSKKRERRRYVSHHTLLTPQRIARQLQAKTVEEFFKLEVPWTKAGVPMWHAQPRVCVNLRQLLQTDTVEFRHFPGTLDGSELLTCIQWCKEFLLAARANEPLLPFYRRYFQDKPFPQFPGYNHALEIGYQATASHNGLKRAEIQHNIQLILAGKFHDSPAYQKAKCSAEGISALSR